MKRFRVLVQARAEGSVVVTAPTAEAAADYVKQMNPRDVASYVAVDSVQIDKVELYDDRVTARLPGID